MTSTGENDRGKGSIRLCLDTVARSVAVLLDRSEAHEKQLDGIRAELTSVHSRISGVRSDLTKLHVALTKYTSYGKGSRAVWKKLLIPIVAGLGVAVGTVLSWAWDVLVRLITTGG